MKICVQGLWHLGTVTAACLASKGHDVIGFDEDAALVAKLNQGIPPLFEPGLEDAVRQGLAQGRLQFTTDREAAVKYCEVLWVAYDTPVDDDDQADVEFVITQIEKTLPYLPKGCTILVSSQLPVGSAKRLEAQMAPARDIGVAISPENLRLGKAMEVFLQPDRIVVGVRAPRDRARLLPLMQSLSERIEWMRVESAEMTKHAINTFLATSVTFANEIAAICELVGADAKEVERGLKTEQRIGPKAYLSPGGAFAGGTLARDIVFLNGIGAREQLATPLLSSVKASNDAHKKWVTRRLQALFPDIATTTVALWGLTYKPGTDTLRRSLAVELVDWLLAQGARVQLHDPVVTALPVHWKGKVTQASEPLGALKNAQALVIATEWPVYKEISPEEMAAANPGLTVFDANRFLSRLIGQAGIRYVAVGTAE